MSEGLGKAVLDLEANLDPFERNMRAARHESDEMQGTLDSLAAVSKIAEDALKQVKMSPSQGAESKTSTEGILAGVRGISDESRTAARELDKVRITEAQAAESELAGDVIDRKLKDITGDANEARRALESVLLAGIAAGKGGDGGRGGRVAVGAKNPGVGVGPFGSGFGRVGLLGTAIGAGVLTAPAAGPAAVGLLASIPVLAGAAAGSVGTLALAFDGVGKAISGDKKAFDDLGPSAQEFVLTVRSLDGWIDKLREKAAGGLFPGLEKGLRAALSPGTIHEIDVAVEEFAAAIGHAGEEWGRYFGSPEFQHIFGPLMREGARDVGLLSDTALHLADSVGVLARDAIPFTDWMLKGIDEASQLADSWIHAKSASGELAHGFDEAKTSLMIVLHLLGALIHVVESTGEALYPVSNIAVKDLSDGLNALAGIIRRNEGVIRSIAITLLTGLVTAVKVAAGGVRLLEGALSHIIGSKAGIVTAIGVIGAVIAATLGPGAAVIVGAILAVGLIKQYWGSIVGFFATLGQETINAFDYVWVTLERGALKAAIAMVEPFTHLPAFLGGWARAAKDSMQAELAKLQPPNMDWSAAAATAAVKTGSVWADVFNATTRKATIFQVGTTAPAGFKPGTYGTRQSTLTNPGGFQRLPKTKVGAEPTPGTHAWYMKYLGYDPTTSTDSTGSPFGTPPPFTKNVPAGQKPSVIPLPALHLESLASQEASQASALHNVGAVAKRHLESEVTDLQKAAKLIRDKYEGATGKAREQLFAALTSVQNKIRSVRALVAKAIKDDTEARLKFAVDQAALSVQQAHEGSAAYDKAVTAEEKALQNEISYYDKRAHNLKLSMAKREEYVRKELAAQKELNRLLKPAAAAAATNEKQFLESIAQIEKSFAPNAFPTPASSGKTDTHLYDLVQESRETNDHLRDIRARQRFPASRYAELSAAAVTG